MSQSKRSSVDRRGFLRSAAAGAAAFAAVLWTAVHHKIPLLNIMLNNRGYHQEVMFVEQQCSVRNRGADMAHIGTKLIEPNINYATMAKAYGMESKGPIEDPKEIAAAFKWGVELVKKGQPVMIDVVTQPRA